ncbi:hypothetical protein C660_11712 [Alcaligenes sp. HPC1271]|uniref:hypothetical protein n=1 Tax=Alcaligenes sp. EGD-AK7 TaxID=1386079 RepID=UPI0002AAA7E1|nr:hypothetical protein [Alcaligenes sp. EGD-AK7]EKU29860.1 hypothetical protein C660_11712 [Alcaligenes sp. HPC1271]
MGGALYLWVVTISYSFALGNRMKGFKALSACAAVAAFSFITSSTYASDLISEEHSFSDSSKKIRSEEDALGGGKRLSIKEEGEKDGAKYLFYHSDGSGRIAGDAENDLSYLRFDGMNWSISCNKDAMNDHVTCRANRGDLLVFYSKSDGFLVDLMGDKYPGSNISIRIDNGQVVTAGEASGFSKSQSKNILASIKDGDKVATRYIGWPYKNNKDQVSEVYGLNVVKQYLVWAVSKIK